MNKPRKTVKIKDIAIELGVSNSLVSKVISGNLGTTKVRPDLQEKILKRAKELDFRPNPLSSALKRGRFGAIGLIVHPIGVPGSELFNKLLIGMSKSLNQHGLRLWLQFYEDSKQFMEFCNQEIYRSVDGLIVAGSAQSETRSLIENLHKEGLPVITSFHHDPASGIANIVYNAYLQGKLATAHLIEKGCKRPAFFCIRRDDDLRQQGYLDAMKEANLPVDPSLLLEGMGSGIDYRFLAGRTVITKALDNGLQFDGIVAQSDQQAIGAINVLRERNISVPNQVRVIGTDDSPTCTASTIQLSSVTAELQEVGGRLVNSLVQYIDGKKPESQLITPTVIERESSR
ncbi:LacI family DNA-binding transcriptional regulator [Cerasicoccus arenae]|uniref:Alanine racemase n=2 Tax=Cerasicoccus arenae TaxID=424488 RepID=A0A8J3GFV0_9BACT|nr:LacI family DNA-binding transcriptional regulator [Cerasicoccus arenae]MBK1859892.1 LacI family DNA-binding transcriptional regulator [Cerasicoccus arenae]GHC08723.1 alanine racemase [Cerasicoccus arenae]